MLRCSVFNCGSLASRFVLLNDLYFLNTDSIQGAVVKSTTMVSFFIRWMSLTSSLPMGFTVGLFALRVESSCCIRANKASLPSFGCFGTFLISIENIML